MKRPRSSRSGAACASTRAATTSSASNTSSAGVAHAVRHSTRYGSPPSSTDLSTSAHRLPHGLNLFAAYACLPRLHRFVALAVEPIRPTELVMRLDQIRAERERLLKEGLRVLEHVALEVHEPQIEMRVQRRLLVVVETDRPRQVLDRLAENSLPEADVADVDPRQRVVRLAHEHLLKRQQRVRRTCLAASAPSRAATRPAGRPARARAPWRAPARRLRSRRARSCSTLSR